MRVHAGLGLLIQHCALWSLRLNDWLIPLPLDHISPRLQPELETRALMHIRFLTLLPVLDVEPLLSGAELPEIQLHHTSKSFRKSCRTPFTSSCQKSFGLWSHFALYFNAQFSWSKPIRWNNMRGKSWEDQSGIVVNWKSRHKKIATVIKWWKTQLWRSKCVFLCVTQCQANSIYFWETNTHTKNKS